MAELKKERGWRVGDTWFATEAEADAFLDREDRIKRATALLEDLQKALTSDLAKKADPVLHARVKSSATLLGECFRPSMVARALAFKPDVLAQLQLILEGRSDG